MLPENTSLFAFTMLINYFYNNNDVFNSWNSSALETSNVTDNVENDIKTHEMNKNKIKQEIHNLCKIYSPSQVSLLRTVLLEKGAISDKVTDKINQKINREVGTLFNKEMCSDIKIYSTEETDKVINAHKFILSSRSNYFDKMIRSGMQESKSGEIILPIPFKSIYHVIEYLYCGDTTIVLDNCLDLLSASNQYELTQLKDKIERTISKNLEVDNVNDILRYADFHNAKLLHKVINLKI